MTQTPSLKTQLLQVSGMDCGSCAKTIEVGWQQLRGITEASVSFATVKVPVDYDPELLSEKTIYERIKALGYTADQSQEVKKQHTHSGDRHHEHTHTCTDHDHQHAHCVSKPTPNTEPTWKFWLTNRR